MDAGMRSEGGSSRKLYAGKLYADGQFIVGDSASSIPAELPLEFFDRARDLRLAVVPDAIEVFTGSENDVSVEVELRQDPPQNDLANWDHVADASIEVATGRLAIDGTCSEPQSLGHKRGPVT